MGTKQSENRKSIYEQVRKDKLGLTRIEAALRMDTIDERRLEYIEKNPSKAQPADISEMAEAYDEPALCSYYCAMECRIGKDRGMSYVEQPEKAELPIIVLKMIASLNSTSQMKDRLIEIAADGDVTEDEMAEFEDIRQELDKITDTVKALELWAEKSIKKG